MASIDLDGDQNVCVKSAGEREHLLQLLSVPGYISANLALLKWALCTTVNWVSPKRAQDEDELILCSASSQCLSDNSTINSPSHPFLIFERSWFSRDICWEYNRDISPFFGQRRVFSSHAASVGRAGKEGNSALTQWRIWRYLKKLLGERWYFWHILSKLSNPSLQYKFLKLESCFLPHWVNVKSREEAGNKWFLQIGLRGDFGTGPRRVDITKGLEVNLDHFVGREEYTKAGRDDEWQECASSVHQSCLVHGARIKFSANKLPSSSE